MMRLVAGRRARATVSVGSEVGTALNSALRHQLLPHVAGALGQRRHTGEILNTTQLPPAAGRRVRIIDADGEAFGPTRRATPTQIRRDVAAGAAEALEYLFVNDSAALLEVGASQVILCAFAALEPSADAKRRNPKSKFCNYNSFPYDNAGNLGCSPDGVSNSNFWIAWQLKARAEVGFDGDPSYRYGFSVAIILVLVA
jgi:hypothetical protein